ncbi:MAG: glutamate--tRNA ligase [Muribaculaceae bacterium]
MANNENNQRPVRVRFAPSPTGPLHIGGVRTALYNYLFARQHGGTMILRIEDTDSRRYVPGAEDYINESLAWLGIKIDEGVREGGNYGPYKQSERRDIYREHVKMLLDAGKAYIAFDTPEELEQAHAANPNFQYDASTRVNMRNSLTMSKEDVDALIAAGEKYVVRFLINPGRDVEVHDLIRGKVVINSSILDDKVLYKSSDDLPTYHLANIVDDHLMEVTHVIRGEEWLPSSPLHVLLYEAFGWQDTMPQFVHLPLLLKPDGKGKLSKRDGDRLGFPVFPLEWHDPKSGEISSGYRESGYLPEAVINFLALLGWNPGDDTEIMSMDELVAKFSFDRCARAGAKFDFEKGKWFNRHYLQQLDDAVLAEKFVAVLRAHGVNPDDFGMEYVTRAVAMVKDRISFVKDLWEQAKFFFVAPTEYEPKAVKKRWSEQMPQIMEELICVLQGIEDFSSAAAEPIVLGWITEHGYHMGNVMNAFRLTVVGECKGPHMFDITELMGKEETIRRIKVGIENIKLPEA